MRDNHGLIVHSLRFIHETPSIMDESFLHCGRGECLERGGEQWWDLPFENFFGFFADMAMACENCANFSRPL